MVPEGYEDKKFHTYYLILSSQQLSKPRYYYSRFTHTETEAQSD